MKKKSYTVQEIDLLRSAVENRYLWGNANGPFVDNHGQSHMGRSYREDEKLKAVEEQVRTYMLAGVTGLDLMKADK